MHFLFFFLFLVNVALADPVLVSTEDSAVEKKPKWNVDGQVVPLGESRTVTLTPHEGVTVQVADPTVVELEPLGNGRYRLKGRRWARTSLMAYTSKGAVLPDLPVSVKPWAARWGTGPDSLAFWGTVTDERVERSLTRWLSARTMIGASVSLSKLKSEDEAAELYQARATAPGALPVEAKFPIKLFELPKQMMRPAEQVVLSNHPERIVSDGVLFDRTVNDVPFRFMWHHRNQPGDPERYLVLQLTNPAPASRKVRMLWYSYGPSPDEIHVGHTAALDYAVAGATGLGEELVLPANGTRTIEIRHMKPGQTMSGMAYLDDVTNVNGPLRVRVLATSNLNIPESDASIQDPGRTASGVFPASIDTEATHVVGGPYTYLEYGGEPYEVDVEEGHPSFGNFGTVYRTRLVLTNPTQEYREVVVGFASGGGAARGVLSLDGQLYDLPMGRSGDGLKVTSYELGPQETRQVDVELFPQAGSNYPVRVVVRSDYDRRPEQSIPPLRPLRPTIP